MSAPDKPLHERIAEYMSYGGHEPESVALLREAAAELSRMRTALEDAEKDAARLDAMQAQISEGKWGDCFAAQYLDSGQWYVRPMRVQYQGKLGFRGYGLVRDAIDAAIAERALTAGSDK